MPQASMHAREHAPSKHAREHAPSKHAQEHAREHAPGKHPPTKNYLLLDSSWLACRAFARAFAFAMKLHYNHWAPEQPVTNINH